MSRDVALERDEAGLRAALEVIGRVEKDRQRTGPAQHGRGRKAGHRRGPGAHGITWRSLAQRLSAPTAVTGERTFLTLADAERIATPEQRDAAPRPLMIALEFTRPPPALLVEPQVSAPHWKKIWDAPAISPAQLTVARGRAAPPPGWSLAGAAALRA